MSGSRYRWNDINSDGIFQEDERSDILSRSGGKYHQKGDDLDFPAMEEVTIGLKYVYKYFESVFNLSGRWFRKLYSVRYTEDSNIQYEAVDRGLEFGPVYNRDPLSYGRESYELTNNPNSSFYAGAEMQLLKKATSSWWFINITASAFIHVASNTHGNGPYFNDIGSYSELDADPNYNRSRFGRTDYDRAYVINIIFGFKIIKGLTLTNTIHYRDGVPFGEFVLVRGLSQGPIAVMDGERAQGLVGLGRYTFHLNWDVRIVYEFNRYFVNLDIYNLLGSSTEVLEDPFRGENFRMPLDTIVPRGFRFTIGYKLL